MTSTVVWGVIRTILAAVAGYFAGNDLFTMDFANEAIAALGVLFVGVWSIVEKMKTPA